MKQKDKELLLKDLTARILYGVCVHIIYKEEEPCYGKLTPRDIQWFIDSKIENIKPYLRPMSSMTEEEKKELQLAFNIKASVIGKYGISSNEAWWVKDRKESIGFETVPYKSFYDVIDWLNAHHFDYRGLIERGLALVAPKGMYK